MEGPGGDGGRVGAAREDGAAEREGEKNRPEPQGEMS